MSSSFRVITALGAVLFALVGLSACGGGVPSGAVVSVNGTPISTETFQHWMNVAAVSTASGPFAKNPVAPDPPTYKRCIARLQELARAEKTKASEATLKKNCETQYKAFKQEVLSFLTSSAWVLGEAANLGVKVTDQEVKKQFEKIKNQQFPKAEEFQKFLKSSGQTVSDLLLRVKLNLISTKIQQKILKSKKVSEAEVTKYYNENKSRYGAQEKRDTYVLLTKTQAHALAAKKEIESGKSFASVAKRVSEDPVSKVKGGLLTEISKGEETPSLDQAMFAAKLNVLTGPIKSPFGYYVIKVTKITPGSQQSLAQARSAIRTQLNATREQQALSKFVKEFKARWKAKTECRGEYVVANCKQYKEPKQGTSTAPTPPGG